MADNQKLRSQYRSAQGAQAASAEDVWVGEEAERLRLLADSKAAIVKIDADLKALPPIDFDSRIWAAERAVEEAKAERGRRQGQVEGLNNRRRELVKRVAELEIPIPIGPPKTSDSDTFRAFRSSIADE